MTWTIRDKMSIRYLWADNDKVMGIVTRTGFDRHIKNRDAGTVVTSFNDMLKDVVIHKGKEVCKWQEDYGYQKSLLWKAFNLACMLRGTGRTSRNGMILHMPNSDKDELMFIEAPNKNNDLYVVLAPMVGLKEESE